MTRLFLFFILLFIPLSKAKAESAKRLTGKVIGTATSVDYSTNKSSTTVNTVKNAFDGDLSTFFASYERSRTWAGLDLSTPHVITRVGWAPRNESVGPKRVCLAVFEGANCADFSDAVPLYMPTEEGVIGQMSYADVSVSQAFRYVRYVGPNDARCNVAEVEFYGHSGEVITPDPAEGEAVAAAPSDYYRPSNLPLVVIHTKDAVEPYDKEHEIDAFISIISDDKILSDTATVRLRGNGSLPFPKKPYRIKWDEKHHVLGSPAKAKKWTLINNYGDKTLMRNILAFELSRRFGMPYTPFCTPVDVMVNGEYKGCYQLCDQVEVGKNRVSIEEMTPSDISTPAITGGYLLEIDAYANDEPVHFTSNRRNPVTIKSPSDDMVQKEQQSYVTSWFNDMEWTVYTQDYDGLFAHLDVESFLRHFLIGELSGNTDTYWSVYLYKPRTDGQFHCGPVWDFDLAFDNDNRTHPINSKSDWLYRSGGSYAGQMRTFVDHLVVNGDALQPILQSLWEEARRRQGINAESLLDFVDETADFLQKSQRLNFMRWPILSQRVHQNYQALGSYAAEVDVVKTYLKNRISWIDSKLHFDPTSIDEAPMIYAADDSDSPFFTISGQRVSEPLSPGVYVKDGRKIIVR